MRSTPVSGAVALLLGAALAVSLPPADARPAARALPVTNGPLLLGDDLINADGSQHQIKVTGTATMAFSPDGGRIAGVTLGNVVKIWSADGSDQTVATLPKTVRDLSWSSDGSSLAALTGDFGNLDHSIYVVPLATGVPAHVYTDTSVNRINLENGLSWQPGGNKILFTSNLPDTPGANDSFTQQLFTVPTTGGAPTQFFVPPALATDPQFRFGTPEWAPDGTRIAVWVQENGSVPSPYQHTYIGVMTAGVAPNQVRAVHVIPPAAAGPYWSTDGTSLLFSDVPAGPGPAPATVIAATGTAVLGNYAYGGQITDWQPCPTGTCVVWGLHTARTLSLQASKKKVAKGKKVTFTGAVVAGGVSVCTAGQAVDLQRAGTGRHATFRHLAGATTDAAGRFTVKVRVRSTARYQVVVTERPDCRGATSPSVKVRVKAHKPHK
jgi:hypothetical protein